MTTVLYCHVSTVDQTVEHQRTQARQNGFTPDLVLIMACRASPLASANDRKGGDCSIFYGKATRLWFAGLIAWGEITRTLPTRCGSSFVAKSA